ncbi:MAG: hypothetical protein IPN92_17740 [Chromatiaceae bacterium]|nr:hypothetical protein [Chromatiaceae bacterium]
MDGKGRGSKKDWDAVVNAYGSAAGHVCDEFPSPIHQLELLAVAQLPILHVVGDADDIVPVAENTHVVVERYRALGGDIRVISKAGVGHHPHGLDDPAPIVDFILSHCGLPPRGEPGHAQSR